MTHRFLSTLSLSLFSVAALAGCPGSETEHDARFADATDAQIERTYGAASGTDLVSAVFIAALFSGSTSEPGACPTVTTSGADTTITGGCTTEDGDRWDGTIEIHNIAGIFVENPAYDPLQPGSVVYDLHIVPFGSTEEVDLSGSVDLDNEGQTLVGDFTVDADGIATTSRLSLGCDEEGPCTASPDSELEIEGLGGAGVEGTWSLGEESATGQITVRGADVLVFDIASRDDAGCIDYAIGDRTGSVCEDTGESAFAPRTSWSSRVSGAAR